MLTSVQIYNDGGKLVLTLPVSLPNPNSSFFVTNIEGLGPVKANINISEYANYDGGVLQSTKAGSRNIIMDIGYRPKYKLDGTVQGLRRELYAYFPPKAFVQIRFLDDTLPTIETTGYIESHDPKIFAKDPEVQISIVCPDSYLKAITRTYLESFNNVAVNPSTTVTAETDFIFDLYVNRPISSVILKNGLQSDIVYNGSLLAGDTFTISTTRGNKYVRIKRGASTINDLDGLVSGSLAMIVDSRVLSFNAVVPGANDIPYRLSILPKFQGV